MPSKERPPNSDLQRAPLLEAQVEIAISAGDTGSARSAADELERIAARFARKALVATAALARGRVMLADGDAVGAEQSLSEAVRLWNEVGAPYEAALARMGLAEALRASGSENRADLERHAARTILDGIQAAPTVAPRVDVGHHDALDEQPVVSVNVFQREGDYWSVTFEGHTVRVRDLKGMRYLARLLADPGREHHVLDLVAAETGTGAASTAARRPACRARHWATRARSSRHEPKTPTADASSRSTTTSSKRAPWRTPNGPLKPTPNATSSFENSPAPLA